MLYIYLQACIQAVENITSGGEDIDKDGLLLLCQLPDGSRGKLHTQLMTHLLPMKDDPVIALLTFKDSARNRGGPSFEDLFDEAELKDDAEVHCTRTYIVYNKTVTYMYICMQYVCMCLISSDIPEV